MTSQLQRRAPMPRGTGFKPAEPKPATGTKPKSCRVCRTKFVPASPLAAVCGVPCAIEYGKAITAKQKAKARSAERAKDRAAREALKPRAAWLRETQAAFNAYVRERDKDLPCISCGRNDGCAWDAGHYRSVGAMPALRFEETNVHKQCVQCNQHRGGNILEYRLGLIERMGAVVVDWLEMDHPPRKFSIDDLKLMKATYKAKLKMLKGQP